jgi:hypothetical protein
VLLGILNCTVMMNKMAHVLTNVETLPNSLELEHKFADTNRRCNSGSVCNRNFTPSSTRCYCM